MNDNDLDRLIDEILKIDFDDNLEDGYLAAKKVDYKIVEADPITPSVRLLASNNTSSI